jgi:transposase
MLLLSDQDHPAGRYTDEQIAAQLGVHAKSVARTRRNFVSGGQAAALDRKRRQTPPVPAKLDGAAEATLVAICCSPAPEGRVRWTLRLLAEELVSRKVVASITKETVRLTLKKTSCSPGGSSATASPSGTPRGSSRRWKTCWMSTRPLRIPTSR